jgi:hypothetical protein
MPLDPLVRDYRYTVVGGSTPGWAASSSARNAFGACGGLLYACSSRNTISSISAERASAKPRSVSCEL